LLQEIAVDLELHAVAHRELLLAGELVVDDEQGGVILADDGVGCAEDGEAAEFAFEEGFEQDEGCAGLL
jgi:hypothetical protein